MTNTIIISATTTTRRPDAISRFYGEAVQVRPIELDTDYDGKYMQVPEQLMDIVGDKEVALWNYDWEDVHILSIDCIAGRNLRMPNWLTIWGRSFTHIGIVVA
jgi:hypothetical protein